MIVLNQTSQNADELFQNSANYARLIIKVPLIWSQNDNQLKRKTVIFACYYITNGYNSVYLILC